MVPRISRVLTAVICMVAAPLVAQDKPARLTFEVASVKPSPPGGRGGGIRAQPSGQRYSAQNAPVKLMISLMYKVPMRQITGGPGWIESDLFDIEAKADHSYSLDDLHAMFENLLADRFKLKFHKESKEGAVYALSVDKSGSKMKVNDSPEPYDIPIKGSRDGVTLGTRVPMQYFCWWLGQVLQRDERPVIDKTGLTGNYDFTLSFAPELPPDFPKENLPPGFLDRPSIFDALREQLGLRLQPQKGPVEFFVIDSAEKPTGN
ncbi:MAG: TIGR03435 family protein [Candidatus Sulfopaludibacter sp.]|nr:TIGR03435 family protein [Candidatus Sulfopaludibacter sp.]